MTERGLALVESSPTAFMGRVTWSQVHNVADRRSAFDVRFCAQEHPLRAIKSAGAWISLIAAGQLAFISAAHAQAPAPAPAPATAEQPQGGSAPPAGYPPPPAGYPPPPAGYPAPVDGAPASPAPPSPAPPSAAPVSPGPLTPPRGTPVNGPIVYLQSSNNPKVRLQTTMQLKWRDVCTLPCGVPVDPHATYRIGGGGARPSAEFRMPRPSGRVLVRADAGSTARHWVGIAMIVGGLGAFLGGALLYSASDSSVYNETQQDTYRTAGVVYMIVGPLVALAGIPVSISNTSVQVE
jgi:hypothetical protein